MKNKMPTQRYDISSSYFGEMFVLTLAAELNGIRGNKCNVQKATVFHTVILQHVLLVSGAKNIRVLINNRLDLWNSRSFKELVNDFYSVSTMYLVRAHGTQNQEQHHRTFSNLVLHGKLREAIRFVFKWETGGGGGVTQVAGD